MTKQIHILGGYKSVTAQLIRAWTAILSEQRRLEGDATPVADLPVLSAEEAAAYEDLPEYEVIPPGFAFAQWFAVHDIPAIVARYSK